ncbi:MurR/RpiR family transcriptional regulator [Actinomyces qiguomingii]|uniref:MurR/RpiR family transcriptional regulator n=1 Tax=Actinomyces qiguomingii TaxID=2057800 RepID=UPI000CA033AB|nr:MurR/RpiR family transcriptional regulator [Actinomyces qiguomingii]
MIKEDLQDKTGFSAAESTVADHLLQLGATIRGLSARAIARQIHTAPSTVVRLCQRLGFEGYPDFRDAYLDELRYLSSAFTDIDANHPFTASDDDASLAGKLTALYHETIDDTAGLLDPAVLTEAAARIAAARSVHVFSQGVQADIAADFADKMSRIGHRVTIHPLADRGFYAASTLSKEDLALAISYSGETAGTLRAVALAARRGVGLIAITSFGRSRLADLADLVLHVSTRERLVEKLGGYAMSLSTLFLLDSLYSAVFNLDHAANLRYRTALVHGYEFRRDSTNPVLRDRWSRDADAGTL